MAKARIVHDSGNELSEAACYDIIRQPVITEKATFAGASGQIVFDVSPTATKPQIKKAVEKIYKVKVDAVNTMRSKGKIKRFRGQIGKRPDLKRAIVTLKEGQNIDVMSGV